MKQTTKTIQFLLSLTFFLTAQTTLLSAQTTQEQADSIVLNYIQNEATQPCLLYVNVNAPSKEGATITTSNGETVRAKYACWVYYLNESSGSDAPARRRYLFVQEESGNLLEIIAYNDLGPADLTDWKVVNVPAGIAGVEKNDIQPLYPNPVDDWLMLPGAAKGARVEIYDLTGRRLFSKTLTDKETGRLNVSFLKAGVYVVNVADKTYKIIKK